jgi:hypothetical protein
MNTAGYLSEIFDPGQSDWEQMFIMTNRHTKNEPSWLIELENQCTCQSGRSVILRNAYLVYSLCS